MSAWQPCGKRLRECIDDVCRSMGECAWPPRPEDARTAEHVREGTGGADSVFSEVMASARPALGRFDWLADAGIQPPPEDWPPDDALFAP